MSTIIEINRNQLNKHDKLKMHFLPAKVHGEGTANVDEFFNNYTRKENDVLTNALRGFPLYGNEIIVPGGLKGVVLQEPHNSETEVRKLRVTGTFEKFTYWNYDKIPSKADAYVQALQWTEMAQQISKPITETEVLEEIKLHKQEVASKENNNYTSL